MAVTLTIDSSQVRLVNRALFQVGREMQNEARQEIRSIGQLVERDVESLSITRIRRLPRSPQWADMRVGQRDDLVYVVPKQKGARRGRQKRKTFAPLMLSVAMRPAKTRNEPEIVRRFNQLTAKVVAQFNA